MFSLLAEYIMPQWYCRGTVSACCYEFDTDSTTSARASMSRMKAATIWPSYSTSTSPDCCTSPMIVMVDPAVTVVKANGAGGSSRTAMNASRTLVSHKVSNYYSSRPDSIRANYLGPYQKSRVGVTTPLAYAAFQPAWKRQSDSNRPCHVRFRPWPVPLLLFAQTVSLKFQSFHILRPALILYELLMNSKGVTPG